VKIAMYVWLLVGLMIGISLINKTIVLKYKVEKLEKSLEESSLRVKVLTILNKENIKRKKEKRDKKKRLYNKYTGGVI